MKAEGNNVDMREQIEEIIRDIEVEEGCILPILNSESVPKAVDKIMQIIEQKSEERKSLIEEAKLQMKSHPSKDARFFAKNVFNFLTGVEVKPEKERIRIPFLLVDSGDPIDGPECITECPIGKLPMVGSLACRECEHNIKTDDEKQYVICSEDGIK